MRLAALSAASVMESMTRGQAWRFLDMGRRLERALNLVADAARGADARVRSRGAAAGGAARGRRQRHDLPPPLPGELQVGAGASTCWSPTRRTRARSSSSWRRWPSTSPRCRATAGCAARARLERHARWRRRARCRAPAPTSTWRRLCAVDAHGRRPALTRAAATRSVRDLPALSDALSGQLPQPRARCRASSGRASRGARA